MKHRYPRPNTRTTAPTLTATVAMLMVALSTGCGRERPGPTGLLPVDVGPPNLAKAPPSPTVKYVFDDGFAGARIKSDGRGQYEDGVCGTKGLLNGTTSDAMLDPDDRYSAGMGNCGPRKFRLNITGGTVGDSVWTSDGSYLTIGGVLGVTAATGPQYQRAGFMTSRAATGCDYIRFGYKDDPDQKVITDSVLVTRTKTAAVNGATADEWTVETTNGHRPKCVVVSGKGQLATLLDAMPFKLTITQTSY